MNGHTKAKIKKYLKVIIAVPFFIGTIGYYSAGESILDAMYYSLGLYGMNLNSDAANWGIEAARWMAPGMVMVSILTIVNAAYHYLAVQIVSRKKDSHIIYSKSKTGKILCGNLHHAVMVSERFIRHGKNHIIMFEQDMDSLAFYQQNQPFFQGKKVYICLTELTMDSIQCKENVIFFHGNDALARLFWKNILPLWKEDKEQTELAILGFSHLGQRIFSVGLQLNLYSPRQKITYHIFGQAKEYDVFSSSLNSMNQDKFIYYSLEDPQKWKVLRSADYVILTQEPDLQTIQALVKSCPQTKIYYYSPDGDKLSEFMADPDRLCAFGADQDIYAEEYIKTDKLYQSAKELNYCYAKGVFERKKNVQEESCSEEEEKENLWRNLSGFLKASNISQADYMDVLRDLTAYSQFSIDELAELEHIRWCRFHFLHCWQYGIPSDGKNKDSSLKIHRCLLPFSCLDEGDRQKNREVIQRLKQEAHQLEIMGSV